MSRIRILQVTAVDFTVARMLRPLVDFLVDRGCSVSVACARGENWEHLVSQGVEMVDIPFRRSFDIVAHARAGRRLLAHLRSVSYDVVHVHTPVAALIGRWAASLAKVPLVLYTAHGFHFHERMHPAMFRFHVALERRAANWHHHLFTQSQEDFTAAIRLGISAPSRMTWIGNGIDTASFDPARFSAHELGAVRKELGLPSQAPVVVQVGRLVREKGLDELLQAATRVCRSMPEARFLVVGGALASDRDAFDSLPARIRELGLNGRVILAGSRDDVPRLLALSSVFVMPTRREGLPRAPLEAMAAGLPTILSDVRGCREETVVGETGFLVPVGDVATLAERILFLLRDGEVARRMGAAARQRALALFDERFVLERQWRVLRALAAERGLPWSSGDQA